ncbi:MAG: type II toxin-antitoxin system VapB family antitoxin [Gallionella sp.]|nr:type II toxin-antitoxin system VapB family antitoxin [Gallionella sp.]MDD4959872.1 type II toxin-antitoxin system VapB family antitoxin [Gallionella sp.]
MRTAKVFRSGNSQAVRIPLEFQFDTDEVEIFRRDDELVLRKIPRSLAQAFHLLTALPDDCLVEREDAPPQVREGL